MFSCLIEFPSAVSRSLKDKKYKKYQGIRAPGIKDNLDNSYNFFITTE